MEIRYDKKAKKFIEALDRPTKQRIHDGIKGLTHKPPEGDIKALQGHDDGRMRLRVGKYRIIYRYTEEMRIEILHIMKVDSRGDVYKH